MGGFRVERKLKQGVLSSAGPKTEVLLLEMSYLRGIELSNVVYCDDPVLVVQPSTRFLNQKAAQVRVGRIVCGVHPRERKGERRGRSEVMGR